LLNSLFAPFGSVQISCQKNKFYGFVVQRAAEDSTHADGSTAPHGGIGATALVPCRPVFWHIVHDFTKIDLWGETRKFCHRGRQGQRVEEPKGPRVKASQAGVRGEKMRWLLSIVSWSAMQGTEPVVGRRPSPRRCPAEMAADRGAGNRPR